MTVKIVMIRTWKDGKPWKASNIRIYQDLEFAKCAEIPLQSEDSMSRFNFANGWHGSGRSFLENLTPCWSHIGGTMSAKLVALEKFDQHSTFKIGALCFKHIKGNKGNKGIHKGNNFYMQIWVVILEDKTMWIRCQAVLMQSSFQRLCRLQASYLLSFDSAWCSQVPNVWNLK